MTLRTFEEELATPTAEIPRVQIRSPRKRAAMWITLATALLAVVVVAVTIRAHLESVHADATQTWQTAHENLLGEITASQKVLRDTQPLLTDPAPALTLTAALKDARTTVEHPSPTDTQAMLSAAETLDRATQELAAARKLLIAQWHAQVNDAQSALESARAAAVEAEKAATAVLDSSTRRVLDETARTALQNTLTSMTNLAAATYADDAAATTQQVVDLNAATAAVIAATADVEKDVAAWEKRQAELAAEAEAAASASATPVPTQTPPPWHHGH